MEPEKKLKFLLVDDSSLIRALLGDLFAARLGVDVDLASSGVEAVERVQAAMEQGDPCPYDWVWCDIEMPVLDGFETLARIRELCPAIRQGMISGADIDQYLPQAYAGRIANIISKADTPGEIVEAVRRHITGEGLAGLENYLAAGARIRSLQVRCAEEVDPAVEAVLALAAGSVDGERGGNLRLGLVEIIVNALKHGYQCLEPGADSGAGGAEPADVFFGLDAGKLGVAVRDLSGKLTRERVLERLARVADPSGEDLQAAHGRGLFITRAMADKVVINIRPGRETEVILLFYLDRRYEDNKPLLIHEL